MPTTGLYLSTFLEVRFWCEDWTCVTKGIYSWESRKMLWASLWGFQGRRPCKLWLIYHLSGLRWPILVAILSLAVLTHYFLEITDKMKKYRLQQTPSSDYNLLHQHQHRIANVSLSGIHLNKKSICFVSGDMNLSVRFILLSLGSVAKLRKICHEVKEPWS